MKFKTTTTINISIALTVIFVIAAGALIYWNKQIWDFAVYVKEQRQLLRNEIEGVKFLSNIEEEIKQTKEYGEYFDKMYIDKDKMVNFIQEIEAVGKYSGASLQIQNVTPVGGGIEEKASLTYNFVNLTMTATGSWEQVNKFLKLIENIPSHVSINVVNMTSAQTEKSVVWSLSMTITGVTN